MEQDAFVAEALKRFGALPIVDQLRVTLEALPASIHLPWVPNPGPQTDAYYCQADELFYGGEAGGGKSDLLIGLGLTAHSDSLLLRRINDDAKDLAKRARAVVTDAASFNGQDRILRYNSREIRFVGCQFEDDKERHKGRPRDLYGFDEICDFSFGQYKFITAWNRSTRLGQRCRVVCTGNPPTRPEGLWVIQYWAAWLDPNHPRPAQPGELRWYIRGPNDEDIEVQGRGPHEVFDGPGPHVKGSGRQTLAKSRTFIRSKLINNPDLAATNYGAMLDSLPEGLRKAYRDGEFGSVIDDDDWQVIPSAWIEAAMQRWENKIPRGMAMTAMAVDVAPGGGDQRVICWRYGGWFAPFDAKREVDKTGRNTAGDVVRHRRDRCPVIVDLGGGWGGDAVIAMKDNGVEVIAFNGVESTTRRSRCGKYTFRNKRAWAAWTLREELDPSQEGGSAIALPNDPELKADLASYRYEITSGGILLEPKENQKERIGRSPDKGDGAMMCLSEGNRAVERAIRGRRGGNRSQTAQLGYASLKRGPGYGQLPPR
jgi:hypothetical protein